VDPRLRRGLGPALIAAASLALLAAGADLVRAQQPDQPPAGPPGSPTDAGPPPPLPPTEVSPSQQKPSDQAKPAELAAPPVSAKATTATPPPGPVSMGPIAQPPAPVKPPEQKSAAAPPPPPPGPGPVRSPVAVIQVLDKVTAETLKFIAPVGRPVRYKTLVFTVKACETRALTAPQPRPAAYVLIESRAGVVRGDLPPAKAVFKGWMFANDPDVHPFEHPVYDAWLVACTAAPPPS